MSVGMLGFYGGIFVTYIEELCFGPRRALVGFHDGFCKFGISHKKLRCRGFLEGA